QDVYTLRGINSEQLADRQDLSNDQSIQQRAPYRAPRTSCIRGKTFYSLQTTSSFSGVVYNHKMLFAARAFPFQKNSLLNGVHHKLDVTVWTCDLAVVELYIRQGFFACDSGDQLGCFIAADNGGVRLVLRSSPRRRQDLDYFAIRILHAKDF